MHSVNRNKKLWYCSKGIFIRQKRDISIMVLISNPMEFTAALVFLQTKKHTMRDREGRPVSSLSWDHDGKYLYCGFVSGRLLQFLLDQWTMEVTPLLDCGSAVVQLSVSGYSLLISTLARSLLLEVNTGRWTQVSAVQFLLCKL